MNSKYGVFINNHCNVFIIWQSIYNNIVIKLNITAKQYEKMQNMWMEQF